jgi:ATP-dependent Lon protease
MRIDVPAINNEGIVDCFSVQCMRFENGNGNCLVTGVVGNAIAEMVQVALSVIKGNYILLKIDKKIINEFDFHVHFTNGSIYKDGTSAGLGIFMSVMYSCLDENMRKYVEGKNILATGEIDLYGNVLEVGGMKEKFSIFKERQYDYFLVPKLTDLVIDDDRIIKVENVLDFIQILKKLK